VPGTTGELRAAKRFDARQFRALIGVLESRRLGSLRRRASPCLCPCPRSPPSPPPPQPRSRIARYAKEDDVARGGGGITPPTFVALCRETRGAARHARSPALVFHPLSRVSTLRPRPPLSRRRPLGPVHSRRVKVASARCGWRPCQTITATLPHPLTVGP